MEKFVTKFAKLFLRLQRHCGSSDGSTPLRDGGIFFSPIVTSYQIDFTYSCAALSDGKGNSLSLPKALATTSTTYL
jgi:hypothetical protein